MKWQSLTTSFKTAGPNNGFQLRRGLSRSKNKAVNQEATRGPQRARNLLKSQPTKSLEEIGMT